MLQRAIPFAAAAIALTLAVRISAQAPSQPDQLNRTGHFSDRSTNDKATAAHRRAPRMEVLSAAEWKRIDDSVVAALRYLASHQNADGSFVSDDAGQPAVTSLCVMAFLSAGHQPGDGPYGRLIERAIDFSLNCQKEDGLFSLGPVDDPIAGNWNGPTHAATYNHSITGLMLGEVYGQTSVEKSQRIRLAIEKAIAYTRRLQERPKRFPIDSGGLRYIKDVATGPGGGDADMSCVAWHLLFLRSAKNAGFDVPVKWVNEMLEFVPTLYEPETGGFKYAHYRGGTYVTRGMTGAGVLSLFLSGRYNEEIEAGASRWILEHPFHPYGTGIRLHDRFHYAGYYCSQAALMIGGEFWEKFYPDYTSVLLENQLPDGSWPLEKQDEKFGHTYSTALSVLSLTPPYQLLPIYQR
jgi:hypothetical protein